MFRSRIIVTNVFKTQKRNAGMLKKNIRVEENAGLREISYKTWEFDQGSLGRIIKWGVIPSILFCVFVIEENKKKDLQIGKKGDYGFHPPK